MRNQLKIDLSFDFKNKIRFGDNLLFIGSCFSESIGKKIQDAGFLSLFRRSRGRDINASCGSLANSKAMFNE